MIRERDRHYQQLTGLLDPDQRAVARKASNTCSRSFDAQPHEVLRVSSSYDVMTSAHSIPRRMTSQHLPLEPKFDSGFSGD
ncbi:hypothetical protein [Paraburkholderia terricola]|jgi:hypothetical protein|uniref:hypothetical protein n=1 Tax=Paraburkholderia terricola TaxID=169427 RepID=UPI003ECDF5A1